jgi:nitroreductase
MIDALEWRYATKKFDASKDIDETQIQTLKRGFSLTPTSYGLQPLRLVVIKNQDIKDRLYEHSYNQIQVKTASHILVICTENTVDEAFINHNFELQKQIRKTTDEILNPFREFLIKDFKKRTDEQIKQWATNQAYLVMGNLLTICAAEKIDACPMEGFISSSYDEVLGLKEKGISSALVLAVGYRAKDDKFADFQKVRRPQEETIIEF